jgi:hypothetical protein
VGSMVQNGKFSAGTDIFPSRLKRVLLPTLGSPTIPMLTLFDGRPSNALGAELSAAALDFFGGIFLGAQTRGVACTSRLVSIEYLQMIMNSLPV